MRHMLNTTLVKIAMHDISQLWMNSKSFFLDREYIRGISHNELLLLYLLFLDLYPWVLFLSNRSLKRIHFLMRWSSFFLSHKYPVHCLSSFKDNIELFVWKVNNQYFKFYSISPLDRNRIIFYINSISPLGRKELMYGKLNKL